MSRALSRDQQPVEPSPSDAALVGAALGGQVWAQEALYRRYVQQVFALAARLLGERDLARDAVHNGFMTAFRKLAKLRDPTAFGAWLRSVVVRETLSMRRRERTRARRESGVDIDSLAGSEANIEERVAFVRLQRWLDGVREPDRTIYLLKAIEGCDNDAIADLVDVSVATVKRKAARVEQHLRALGKDGRDD